MMSINENQEKSKVPVEGSSKICPSQSTAYVSMLPFAYTNNDVAQLFSRFGKIAKVTILRDRATRKSKGVAFVQFVTIDACKKAVAEMNNIQLEGFTLRCCLTKDNGRSREFIKKRKYTSKEICFECGSNGHLSYDCPKNVLGSREKPPKKYNKKFKVKSKDIPLSINDKDENFSEDEDIFPSSLICYPVSNLCETSDDSKIKLRKHAKLKQDSYFSDEDARDD